MTDVLTIPALARQLRKGRGTIESLIEPDERPGIAGVIRFGDHTIEVIRFGRTRYVRRADVERALHLEPQGVAS